MTYTPYHHAQILRTLPGWSKALHPDHASRIVQSLRKDYLDADGVAYPWYESADMPTRQALQRTIAQRDASRQALQAALGALQNLATFCTPLLQQQLNLNIPVDQAQYVYQPTEVKLPIGVPPGSRPPSELNEIVPKGPAQYRSLLEAALHNFEGPADTTSLSRLQRSHQDILPIEGLSLGEFIEQTRALDLGQRYQAHLDAIFEGPEKSRLHDLAVAARRDAFRVQVRIAACKGLLDATASAALHQLCADEANPTYDGRPLRCWQVQLFGAPIHEVLFIAPEENRSHDPVFLYNPADEDSVNGFASLGEAYQHLRTQLLNSDYRRRFVALALQAQQPDLNTRLQQALFSNADKLPDEPPQVRDSIHLETQEHPLHTRPWSALEANHLVRLRADARKIAVPTADVDAQVRLRNLAYWFDIGLNVVNVAAMFVPCLNPIMLTLGASQILQSVFEGVSAWEDGDSAQALAQLESVLLNVAVVGAVGVGGVALKASGFVDGLQSIVKDGKEQLWSGTLKGYANAQSIPEHLEPDAQGRYTLEGRYYVRMEGELFEQVQQDGRWQVNHPQDPQAYRPALLGNGEGAWRTVHENPAEWDQRRLLRRLGPISEGLDDSALNAAMQCAGEHADTLRHAQVGAQPTPALLADILDRLRSTRQVDDIIDRVRHDKPLAAYKNFALPSLTELEDWPQQHVIKAYSGPESWGDYTRYGKADEAYPVQIEINRSELENGQLSARIVAQLDEQAINGLGLEGSDTAAQAKALSDKLARHLHSNRQALFERVYSRHASALPQQAQTIAGQFPGVPHRALQQVMARISAGERQQLGNGRVPLRVAEEARALQAHARLNKALLGLYRPELANADSATLDAALKAEHPDADAQQRFERAAADRAHAAKLIGQQPIRPGYRSPMRLADGRAGYLLSGRRPFANPAQRQLRALYPGLSEPELSALLRQLRQRGDLAGQIRALQFERDTLADALRQWQEQAPEPERARRASASDLFNRAWRRDDPDSLNLETLEIGGLPSLPARFDHITSMNIRNIGIRTLPADFFQSFPSLRTLRVAQSPELDFEQLFAALAYTPQLEVLELGNNQLDALTANMRQRLAGLTRLRRLNLRLNQLQLTDADLQTLSQLPIEYLDLENNQIALTPDLAARFSSLAQLRELRLTNNPLQHAPDVTGLAQLANLQLRNCVLHSWPNGLTALMTRADLQLRMLSLSYNPITALPDLEPILASPFAQALRTGRVNGGWDFNANDLDAQSNRRLRATGVEIDSDSELSDASEDFWPQHASPDRRALWDELFAGNANPHLRDVVERVANSAQARDNLPEMTNQVWQLLEQAGGDQALRSHLETVAQEYPPTCGDAGADGFSALELEALAFRELAQEADRPYYLFNFFRRLYRREMVNALAEQIQLARLARQARLLELERLPPEAPLDDLALPALDELDGLADDRLLLGGTDLIEIRLALRQSLAYVLDFPETRQGMLYRAETMVSEYVVRNVEYAVLALDQAAAQRRAWVARLPIWQRYLSQHFAEQFAAFDERWYQGLQYLDYCLDAENEAVASLDQAVLQAITDVMPQPPLDEAGQLRRMDLDSQAYDQASRRLNAGRDLARQALLEQLTGEQDPNN
nr:DUF6543 domain-containing protein [uncultured Pseudomonas sp.]